MAKADKVLPLEVEHGRIGIPSEHQPTARVLAVDDEPAACKLLSFILCPPAFQCSTASNGEEALAMLQREQFDAIISDLHMPGISGMELLTQVRRRYPHMAFMVITGADDVDVGVQ